jgi:LmbE family N-acetylglucosaminyl deacetylase
VITFGPDGAYGHPDHVAISQLTTAAITRAADRFRVSKLYYMAWSAATWRAYQAALKTLTSTVDGVVRQATPTPDWAITTRIDTTAVWPTVWRAVQRHHTQISIYRTLEHLPPEHHRALWGTQEFYRVFSLVNGGRACESDLFEGLR